MPEARPSSAQGPHLSELSFVSAILPAPQATLSLDLWGRPAYLAQGFRHYIHRKTAPSWVSGFVLTSSWCISVGVLKEYHISPLITVIFHKKALYYISPSAQQYLWNQIKLSSEGLSLPAGLQYLQSTVSWLWC